MARLAKRVLLIGWDAADWQHIDPLLEEGLLPGLRSLMEGGVWGNAITLQPILSPMLWNSIATGKTADKHGILGFTEPLPGLRGIRPFSSRTRKVKAIWNILTQNGLRSNVVAWWASHPAEPVNGIVVSHLFKAIRRGENGLKVPPGTVHPPELAETLGDMKMDVDEITAEDVLPFIPNAAKIDQEADKRFFVFCKILSDCASVQALTTTAMEHGDWDFTAVYFDAIDHFCHAFMPFHPPRMSNVKEEDFEMYKGVIRGAYQFHDMILQRLLHLAGEDTIVVLCSDHGFQSQHMRPRLTPQEPAGPAAWHREHGILVVNGPGIRKGERIYGASVIDITPTILHAFGLPVGEDMDGRVLLDAFEPQTPPRTVPSWEDVPGESGMLDHAEPESPAVAQESDDLVKQFVALGYIEDPGDDSEKAAAKADLETKYNLARVYISTNRPAQALPLLRELVKASPWEDRYWKHLAMCCSELGYHRQAISIMENLYRDWKQMPTFAQVLVARSSLVVGDFERVDRVLPELAKRPLRMPHLRVTVGRLLMLREHYTEAEDVLRKAIEIDPNYAPAHQELSSVLLRRHRYEEAAHAGLDAVMLLFRLPRAHWNIGLAMWRLERFEDAVAAFETLLRFDDPRYQLSAHRCLARINRRHLRRSERAELHRSEAKRLSRQREMMDMRFPDVNRTIDLPEIPDTAERSKTIMRERPRGSDDAPGSSGKTFIIVSGLPRSGTSLMMQMLESGGLAPRTDGVREADVDNPEGYYEWEAIKQVAQQPDLLDEEGLESRAIKAVSMLLSALPRRHRYKIIFMNRPTDQVAASQRKMIDRLGTEGMAKEQREIASRLQQHRDTVHAWLGRQPNMTTLHVDFPELIQNPEPLVEDVVAFLGPELLPHAERMAAAVRPDLHRQR